MDVGGAGWPGTGVQNGHGAGPQPLAAAAARNAVEGFTPGGTGRLSIDSGPLSKSSFLSDSLCTGGQRSQTVCGHAYRDTQPD